MSDILLDIRKPIEAELEEFTRYFNESLSHTDGTLSQALNFIRQRAGKRMRPILTLLIAKCFGQVNESTHRGAVGLELLHTASLVHDDIVDESKERRGQASVNAVYDNRVSVLVGDYILSSSVLSMCKTRNIDIVTYLSQLGQTLSSGEILQMTSNGSDNISEEDYYEIIRCKTASLFEACAAIGSLSVNASESDMEAAKKFGLTLGMMFQIRDDIFDYFEDSNIGKPTGNDMLEGKLTLPAIHVVLNSNNDEIRAIAMKVKDLCATPQEIAQLVEYTKTNGGIEYAEQQMERLYKEALVFVENNVRDNELKHALTAYLNYVIQRKL